jgi:hypothetical protein
MSDDGDKKYSKISLAQKYYFLKMLYYKSMTIKDVFYLFNIGFRKITFKLLHRKGYYTRFNVEVEKIYQKINSPQGKACKK